MEPHQPPPPTIPDAKIQFLRRQIKTLSQPLSIDEAVLERALAPHDDDTDEPPLTRRAVDAAVLKANTKLRRHFKVAYAAPAVRHVGEQIGALYWARGDTPPPAAVVVDRSVDLRDEEAIAELPVTWEGAEEYTEARRRLEEVDARRRAARERLAAVRRVRDVVAGLEGVQGGLVTKGGEVEGGLERMRMLMLRVERGLGGLERGEREEEEEEVLGGEEERLERLMGAFV